MLNHYDCDKNIFESMDIAIAIIGADDTVSYYNTPFDEMNVLPEESSTALTLNDIYPEETAERVKEIIRKFKTSNQREKQSILYTSRQRTERNDIFSNIIDEKGGYTGTLIRSQELNTILEEDLSDLTMDDDDETLKQESTSEKEHEEIDLKEILDIKKSRENEKIFLARLYDLTSDHTSLSILMEQILNLMIEMLKIDSGIIKVFTDQDKKQATPITFYGLSDAFIKKLDRNSGLDCICSKAIKTDKMAYTKNISKEREFRCSTCKDEGFKFVLSYPLHSEGNIKGILQLCSRQTKELEEHEVIFIETACKIIDDAFAKSSLEEMLASNREFLKKLLAKTDDNLIVVSDKGLITAASNSFYDNFSLTKDNVLQKKLEEVFTPQLQEEFTKLFETDNDYKKPDNITHTIETTVNNGEKTINASVTIFPTENQGGSHSGSIIKAENRDLLMEKEREIEECKQELNSYVTFLKAIIDKKNTQELTEIFTAEIAKIIPVEKKQFILYMLNTEKDLFELNAILGVTIEFGSKECCLDKNSQEISSVLQRKTPMYIPIPASNIKKLVIPLISDSEVQALIILFTSEDITAIPEKSGILTKLFSMAIIPSAITGKPDLPQNNEEAGVEKEKKENKGQKDTKEPELEELEHYTEILLNLSKTLQKADSNTLEDNTLENFLMTLLAVTGYDRITLQVMNSPNSMEKITISRTQKMERKISSAIFSGSREEWVLQNRIPIYEEILSQAKQKYTRDEDLYPNGSVYVLPLLKNDSVRGTLKLESEEPNPKTPFIEALLQVTSVIMLIKVTLEYEQSASEYYISRMEDVEYNYSSLRRTSEEIKKQNTALSSNVEVLNEKIEDLEASITTYKDEAMLYEEKLQKALGEKKNIEQTLAEKEEKITIADKENQELSATLKKAETEIEELKIKLSAPPKIDSEIARKLSNMQLANTELMEKNTLLEETIRQALATEKELYAKIDYLELTAGEERVLSYSAKTNAIFKDLQKSIKLIISSENLNDIYKNLCTLVSKWYTEVPSGDINSGNLALYEQSIDELASYGMAEPNKEESKALSILITVARIRGKELTMLKELLRKLHL